MERDFQRYTSLPEENYSRLSLEDETPNAPAKQSGRAKPHATTVRGNHRSGLRGKGREAFSRNNWMKNVI